MAGLRRHVRRAPLRRAGLRRGGRRVRPAAGPAGVAVHYVRGHGRAGPGPRGPVPRGRVDVRVPGAAGLRERGAGRVLHRHDDGERPTARHGPRGGNDQREPPARLHCGAGHQHGAQLRAEPGADAALGLAGPVPADRPPRRPSPLLRTRDARERGVRAGAPGAGGRRRARRPHEGGPKGYGARPLAHRAARHGRGPGGQQPAVPLQRVLPAVARPGVRHVHAAGVAGHPHPRKAAALSRARLLHSGL